jgi:hypothetical protein
MKPLKTNLLASCAPSMETLTPAQNTIIRRPSRDMACTIIGEGIEISCLIESIKDESGKFSGEIFYPVIGSLQTTIKLPLRAIKFHPTLLQDTQNCIFPQKLPTAARPNCAWALSMAEALNHPFGTWFTITSDRVNGLYHHDVLVLPEVKSLEWPGFRTELEAALAENIIDRSDHPVIKRLQEKTSPKTSFENFTYDL